MEAGTGFNPENYNREKLTIDIVRANLFGLRLFIPVVILYGLPYYLIWKDVFTFGDFKVLISLKALVAFFMGIAAHELIHGIVWTVCAPLGFKSIRFGVLWQYLAPYCHCKEPLKVKHYIIGGIMPAIVLGLVPAAVALYTGSLGWLLFGIFFTVAACGDFLIVLLLLKESRNSWVQDHPSEAGCYIYRPREQTEATTTCQAPH